MYTVREYITCNIQYTVYRVNCIRLKDIEFREYIIIVYSVRCTIYVRCTLYTLHCTVCTVHCTVYTVHYTLYSVHSVYNIHRILYDVHYTFIDIHEYYYRIREAVHTFIYIVFRLYSVHICPNMSYI